MRPKDEAAPTSIDLAIGSHDENGEWASLSHILAQQTSTMGGTAPRLAFRRASGDNLRVFVRDDGASEDWRILAWADEPHQADALG